MVFFENIIVGAGPAGLQMAYYLEQAKQPYVVIEKANHVGAFFSTFPRKGHLISVNKRYCGETASDEFKLRFDWNSLLNDDEDPEFRFTKYSEEVFPTTDCLRAYLQDFADTYELSQHIVFNSVVNKIRRTDCFHVELDDTTYQCNRLFYGAGVVLKEVPDYLSNMANELGAALYSYADFPMDEHTFKNKHVCVIGTGNAAFEAAEHINKYAASIAMFGPAKVAWRQHYPGFLRSNNMSLLDTFFLKINNVLYTTPEKLNPFMNKHRHEYFTCMDIHLQNDIIMCSKRGRVDAIVYCGGFRFNDAPFDSSSKPTLLNNGFPEITSAYESTNIPGLYFIGTLMQGCDYKKGSSAFIHGFRYNIRHLARHLFAKIVPKKMTHEECFEYMIERINNSSCLSLRYECFADCCVFVNDNIDYYEDVPVSFAKERGFARSWTIRLGFSRDFNWSFIQDEYTHPADSHKCAFIHPIIAYVNETKAYEFHITESSWAQFTDPSIHVAPLKMYWEFAVTKQVDAKALRKAIEAFSVETCTIRHTEVFDRLCD